MNDYSVQTEEVPCHVAELVIKLLRGWRPRIPKLSTPSTFHWDGRDLSSHARALALNGKTLEVKTRGLESLYFDDDDREALMNKGFRGALNDGSRFIAEISTVGINKAKGHYWVVTHPERPAQLWVARVKGLASFRGDGNLSVDLMNEDGTGLLSGDHHRFQGTYTYYLIADRMNGQTRWFFVIDTGTSAPPTRADLSRDIGVLQFVLGRPCYVDVIHGIDRDGRQVAVMGGRLGRDSPRAQYQPPVPTTFTKAHWASVLFATICRAYRERPEVRFQIPLWSYIQALATSYVEARYLLLHVALEAFAYWNLEAEPKNELPPLVDGSKWRKWLKENKAAIVALVPENAPAKQGERLFDRFTSIPARKPSSRLVEDAFALAHVGLTLTPEMEQEMEKGRGTIVHTAVIFAERREIKEYQTRIALVRTMLVALVARVAGYRGAILGWTKSFGREYDEADPSWWCVDDDAKAAALRKYKITPKSLGPVCSGLSG